jgi:hypothetical protein
VFLDNPAAGGKAVPALNAAGTFAPAFAGFLGGP